MSNLGYRGYSGELEIGLIAAFTALAIVLHLFRVPFPLATFLQYDLSGVPLILLVILLGLRRAAIGAVFFGVGVFILGGDYIGAFMKALAEFSSMAGVAIVHRRLSRAVVVATSALLRTVVMAVANMVVTPIWLLYFARACDTYSSCFKLTLYYIPAICLFNLSLGLAVAAIGVSMEKYVERIVRVWRRE